MFGFFDIVQAYFTQITGRFIMFSARDVALLEQWRDQGASAAGICRGVRDAVLQMGERDPPRSLYNCREYIEPYVERARSRATLSERSIDLPYAQAARSGRVSARPAPCPLRRALAHLERAGGSEDVPDEVRALYRATWYRIKALLDQGIAREDQFAHLLEIEEQLVGRYIERALDGATRRQFEARIESEARALGATMSVDAWERHTGARRRQLLVREYGMISLID